ncbi:hypothetical protein [Leptolyngbya sp. 7M]|uniref:hypothetical protein n=1 Tax=Leptolyngbya sp. 7M TaxID=2812896 RepID=UPI001B8D706A|nr:hypothetical protein [Leptolyngbya sp. 7M]QYO63062.1 hypothetical protein JVX88_24265 [Leptolyngbya sp. 7M]
MNNERREISASEHAARPIGIVGNLDQVVDADQIATRTRIVGTLALQVVEAIAVQRGAKRQQKLPIHPHHFNAEVV